MANLFDEMYNVTINLTDSLPTRADLRTYSIVGEAVATGRDRVDTFQSISELSTYYPSYTKVYKMVNAAFTGAKSKSRNTPTIKILGKLNVFNLAIDTVIDSTVYTVTINGEDITYTSGTGATSDEIKAGLVLAINSSGQGLDVNAIEGVGPDLDIFMRKSNQTVTEADANMSLTSRLETLTEVLNSASGSFYFFSLTSRAQADVVEVNTYAGANTCIFMYSTEQGVAKTSSQTGIMGVLFAATAARSGGIWSHQSGVDFTNASGAIAAGILTVTTSSAHGLRDGDLVTLENVEVDSVVSSDINKENTATVLTPTTFTVPTTESGTVTTAGNGFGHFLCPESTWVGRNVTGLEGAGTWAKNVLSGNAASDDYLDATAQANITSKSGNFYLTIGGKPGTISGAPKFGGFLHNGRFIDTQWGIDTLKIRTQEALNNLSADTDGIPFTSEGLATVESAIQSAGSELLQNGFLTTINDQPLEVFMPNVNDISATDKANRILRNIVVQGQIAGKIHSFNITINLAP